MREARVVVPGVPHHIVQRGNRRENVFFTDRDRRLYLDWLRLYGQKEGLEFLSYCLMTNHVHLVAVPDREESLQRVFRPLHTRYAHHVNRLHGWVGHVWQGRYFSSPLDEDYMWAAIRYSEQNPVRARATERAEKYRWSSAAAHCGLRADPLLTRDPFWLRTLSEVQDWSKWLAEFNEDEQTEHLRSFLRSGFPCGSARFIDTLQGLAERSLRPRHIARRPEGTVT